jgi:hypothetical protein
LGSACNHHDKQQKGVKRNSGRDTRAKAFPPFDTASNRLQVALTKILTRKTMPEEQPISEKSQTRAVLLINAIDNPLAQIDDSTFQEPWRWIRTPKDWKPGEPLPVHTGSLDAIIVFSARYHDDDIRHLCEAVRALPELASVPLLVGIDQYQMPLANNLRQMPNTDFIVTPIEEKSLISNLQRAVAGG